MPVVRGDFRVTFVQLAFLRHFGGRKRVRVTHVHTALKCMAWLNSGIEGRADLRLLGINGGVYFFTL